MLVVAVLVIWRAPKLVPYIETIKFKDFSVTLRRQFAELRPTVEAVQTTLELPGTEPVDDKTALLAEIDAGAALLFLWEKLESAVINLIQHNGLIRFTRPSIFVRWLADNAKITEAEAALYFKLAEIHETLILARYGDRERRTLNATEVNEYNNGVELLIRRFEALKAEPGYLRYPIPNSSENRE
jgi:hypothetical protein